MSFHSLKYFSGDVMSKVEKVKYQESGIETHLKKVKQMLRDTTERVESKAESKDFENVPVEKPMVQKPLQKAFEKNYDP